MKAPIWPSQPERFLQLKHHRGHKNFLITPESITTCSGKLLVKRITPRVAVQHPELELCTTGFPNLARELPGIPLGEIFDEENEMQADITILTPEPGWLRLWNEYEGNTLTREQALVSAFTALHEKNARTWEVLGTLLTEGDPQIKELSTTLATMLSEKILGQLKIEEFSRSYFQKECHPANFPAAWREVLSRHLIPAGYLVEAIKIPQIW